MKTIANEWREFKVAVIPREASDVQKEEMQKAFYAGATSMYNLVTDIDEDMPDEEAVKMLGDLADEITAFAKKMIAEQQEEAAKGDDGNEHY